MRLRLIVSTFMVATIVYAIRTKQSDGAFLGVPFEFRLPTPTRVRQRLWNPEDSRIFTPHVLGVGWSVNVYQVLKRLGLTGNDDGEPGTLDEREA